MFTLAQIKEAHSKVQSGKDFPEYIKALTALGITHYTSHVEDGHTQYFGKDEHEVASSANYGMMAINHLCDQALFTQKLKAHQSGLTDYLTFCKDCADSGIHHWIVSMASMTCTYYDVNNKIILEESIPQ